jgi:hypothetical protein
MPFYPPNPGRRPFPSSIGRRIGPLNKIGSRPRPFRSPIQSQQVPTSRFDGLKTIMGHVGNVTNGINMLRQVGSFLKIF